MSDRKLGALWDGGRTRFRLYSGNASAVELCLFDETGSTVPRATLPLSRGDDDVWQLEAEDAGPGQLYAYRVDGPRRPERGHRFDPAKLLVDPYARAVAGEVVWHQSLVGSDGRDDAAYVPRSVVCDPTFDWGDDAPPRTPWRDTVIYECHVRGMTRRHPDVPEGRRGTYLGLTEEPVLDHLRSLGVTALELMPVQQFTAERHLAESGRSNYWGYSPLAWFAPHADYASGSHGRQVDEFRTMVRRLHRAGLEVLLDVVFNHTAEGGVDGPTLSLRGIDNAAYYRLAPGDPASYVDFTGCGNTIDFASPAVRRLVLDCLRYWVAEMHIDGFRFDLATTMGRGEPGFSPRAPLFAAIAGDPLLSRVKLIAEPWDLGRGGYRAGGFPEGWREWNDRYRNDVRTFWLGTGRPDDFATRVIGSPDLYGDRRSGPSTGVTYVACHDGFTLHDLVSYARKHNLDNGEGNRDGPHGEPSANLGVEGPTDDPTIRHARLTLRKSLLATVALSAGVPMIGHGDEMGRTQRGNSNPYCIDGEVTWVDWELDDEDRELLRFARRAFALRRRLGVAAGGRFPTATETRWLGPDGGALAGRGDGEAGERGVVGILETPTAPCATLLLWCNAESDPVSVPLPEAACGHRWTLRLTSAPAPCDDETPATGCVELPARSLTLFTCVERAASGS